MSLKIEIPAHSNFASYARWFARQNIPVFPLIPRGKTPLISKAAGGNGFKDATIDEVIIDKWATHYPDANLGTPTGSPSGFDVVDVDNRHGGLDTLNNLEREFGPLPTSVRVLTGNGFHIYFRHVAGVRSGVGSLGAGVDVRGEGGYVAAPPSVHPSGKRYEFLTWHYPLLAALEPIPDWLLAKLQSASLSPQTFMRRPRASTTGAGGKQPILSQLFLDGVTEGGRNQSVAALTGHFLSRRIDPLVVREIMLWWNSYRCYPPLPAAEVDQVVESICGRQLRARSRRR